MNRNDVLTDPKKLVKVELKNKGYDIDTIQIPKRVYLLADDIFDKMESRNVGRIKYPLGGKLYVFFANENVGFVKGNMCSPAIATQAEDLIAGGVQELIHIGYAGGLQLDQNPGDIVLTDGAFNDTAVARLYGYDCEIINSTKSLTDDIEKILVESQISYKRGIHWTTDAGYRETWGQILEYREKNALCVEMEGVGLFTIANYRSCKATGIYIISDVYKGADWELGWDGLEIEKSVSKVIDMIIRTVDKNDT
jgi:purine-nucleoside phosphorylase